MCKGSNENMKNNDGDLSTHPFVVMETKSNGEYKRIGYKKLSYADTYAAQRWQHDVDDGLEKEIIVARRKGKGFKVIKVYKKEGL